MKVLAGIRRRYAEEIGRFIFPIVVENLRDESGARHSGKTRHRIL